MTDPFTRTIEDVGREGPLAGLRLAVKDLFDLAGVPTGAGNPRWLETHAVPTEDAAAVALLRNAGARVVGKTITDELAWSLNGTNAHYGTPDNPAAPGCVPGGSSSGSASAVALGLADIGLGTDTGGSIRVPASYCGLYGLRPTHGRVSLAGAVPLAPSFDTAGVLARDAATLRAAMGVLLGGSSDGEAGPDQAGPGRAERGQVESDRAAPITRLLAPQDVWDEISPETRAAVIAKAEALGLAIDREPLFGGAVVGVFAGGTSPLETARVAYATLQAWEAWQTHGAWIEEHSPEFGSGVAARFRAAASIGSTEIAAAQRVRSGVVALVRDRLPAGVALAIPAAPGPAFRIGDQPNREAIVRLTCIAGLAGAPGLAVPAGTVDGLPVGLQLVAAPGTDERLLELA